MRGYRYAYRRAMERVHFLEGKFRAGGCLTVRKNGLLIGISFLDPYPKLDKYYLPLGGTNNANCAYILDLEEFINPGLKDPPRICWNFLRVNVVCEFTWSLKMTLLHWIYRE